MSVNNGELSTSGAGLPDFQLLLQAISNCAAPVVHQLVRQNHRLVRQKGWHGQTALHRACLGGDWTVTFLLLEAGADPNATNEFDETPLHYACRRGQVTIVHLLFEHGANYEAVDKNGRCLMHFAAQSGSVYVMHYLSSVRDMSFRVLDQNLLTPLHIVCQHGHMEAFKYLLKKERCDLFQADSDGNTAIHLAAKEGYGSLVWLVLVVGGLKILDIKNKEGFTAAELARPGNKVGHANLNPVLQRLSRQTNKDGYPRGPLYLWYWLLIMPMVVYGVTIFCSRMYVPAYQTLIVAAVIGVILYCVSSSIHRISHICRWPSPVYAGFFAAGFLHTYIFYFFHLLPIIYEYVILAAVCSVISFVTFYIYVVLLRRDPGALLTSMTKDDTGALYSIKDLCVAPAKPEQFCMECEIVRRPLTKHCRLCEQCFLEMDHHCLFLLTCIAKNNHRLFVWFIILLSLSMVMMIGNCIMFVLAVYPTHTIQMLLIDIFNEDAWLLTLLIGNAVSFVWSFKLVIFQFSVVSRGFTTYFRPRSSTSVLTPIERILNVWYFLRGKEFYVKDPLYV